MDVHELVSRLKQLALELGRTPTLVQFVASGASKRQIQKHKYSELCRMAGLEVNKHPAISDPIEPVIRPPRILFFDIETAPITGYTWGVYEQNVIKVIEEWFVLSYAAKFKDDDRMFYLDQRYANPIQDDFQLLCGIHHLIEESDIIVTHNGDRFDRKKLNARFIKHGLPPLNHYQSIDTLKIARKHFAFTSNKLSDLASYLQLAHQKSSHGAFPGFSMWDEMLKGNIEAFKACEEYNAMDVLVLEQVFNKLAPWDPSINLQAFYQKQVCICGSEKFFKNGYKYTRQGKFQVYRCSQCSKCFVSKTNEIDKDMRSKFTK